MLERIADGWSALYFDGSTHGSPLTLGGMICGWPKATYTSSAAEESSTAIDFKMSMPEMPGMPGAREAPKPLDPFHLDLKF
jgi:hypothetical protein